jgi:hypothetical protein
VERCDISKYYNNAVHAMERIDQPAAEDSANLSHD